ncbi:MAG: class I SAM-dependent methyltransferase [Candidatus Latescibacterota bacterium]
MKGFVPTPPGTVDAMVELLFRGRAPRPDSTVLDPGCGTGEFVDGVIRWCARRGIALPHITGIESDPRHIEVLRGKYGAVRAVRVEHADFLSESRLGFDYVVGNPPYVAITGLSESEKASYRARYATARGRFDLYMLFFEQALRSLSPGGRLVFITPEKYLYVETAGPLRGLLARRHVEEIRLVSEDTFGPLVTYPTITVVTNAAPGTTQVARRDGTAVAVDMLPGRHPWFPLLQGAAQQGTAVTLGEVCVRISAGVATGADAVFVWPAEDLDPALRCFAHATVAGRELTLAAADPPQRSVMLLPYDANGRLLPLDRLGALRPYLMRDDVRRRLLARTCVRHKPWYAYHETPPLRDILRPKILCKDIGDTPHFWVDRSGHIIPRHSVYYIVPREPGAIDLISGYLRSPSAHQWLTQNCQRAAKGFLRLQSRALRRLPLPEEVAQAAGGSRAILQAPPRQGELAFVGQASDEHTV